MQGLAHQLIAGIATGGIYASVALALVMTIPLLRFLQMQLTSRLGRHLMTLWMMLCAASALGSHSRGGLLAIVAMTLVLWWRGRNKFFSAVLIGAVGVALLLFMPAEWTERTFP